MQSGRPRRGLLSSARLLDDASASTGHRRTTTQTLMAAVRARRRTDHEYRDEMDQLTQGLPVVSPANMLPVQVIDVHEVAPEVVSVQIVLPGSRQAPAPYLPGQFVTLALPTPRETLYRSYSLCGPGDHEEPWELTIKRVDQGAVSTYFYDSVHPGTLLYASLPRGTFTLPAMTTPDDVLCFIAVGSGITPIMGMLRAIARLPEAQRPLVHLHYASRSEDDIIYGDELGAIDPYMTWLQQQHYLSSQGRRLTIDRVLGSVGPGGRRAHWYVCGPESLKHELTDTLQDLGVPASQIHAEVFATSSGPAYRIEGRGGAGIGGKIHVTDTGAILDAEPRETLLTALERHGYRPEFSCRAGSCGTCKLRVLDGQVDPVGEALSPRERAAGYVLSCIAHPIGEVTLASGGRPPKGVERLAGVAIEAATVGASKMGKTAARVAALVGVAALATGVWNLTNHRPVSWGFSAAAAPAVSQPSVSPQAGTPAATAASGTPGSSSTPGSGGSGGTPPPGAAPTATSQAGGGAPPPPAAPTATPAPQPTATPKPVATSTPSH